jgi:nucleoside-triphosphatase THEP1
LEIILIDAEAQKHFGPALVRFAMSEVKSRVTKLGEKMTRTEAFDKAWRIAFKEKDFSLVDEIYHPEYAAYDDRTGIDVNLEADKTVVLTLKEAITFGPPQTVSEDEEILEVHRFANYKGTEIFISVTSRITYKDGKIITQSTKREALNHDPSEGQDWNWEDYE